MTIRDLIRFNRCYRRFHQELAVERATLKDLVDLARLSASSQNLQPLKYFLSCEPSMNNKIFPWLGWAAYLEKWSGPPEGERPAAYILVLGDKSIGTSFAYDAGIAAQSIRLGVAEIGLGSAIVASIKRPELAASLELSDRFEILLAIAIGKPKETVVLEAVKSSGDIKYWRDTKGVHHVPKRSLKEIIINYTDSQT